MIRNFFGITFYIFAGFFVYMICLLAFISAPELDEHTGKLMMLTAFSVPLIIFLFLGMLLYRGNNWKITTGTTLLSGTGLNLFVVITFICIQLTPELSKRDDIGSLLSFNDYLTGFITTSLVALLGAALFYRGRVPINKSRLD